MANTTSETDVGELEITDELIAERRAEQPGETPEDMTPWQRPITAFIDVMTDKHDHDFFPRTARIHHAFMTAPTHICLAGQQQTSTNGLFQT